MSRTIFEKVGGFTTVSRVVMSFYDKILDSPVTSPYFANTDMKRLIDHQTKFIASVMGGPVSYTNQQIQSVHAHLGISEAAFDEAMELLVETFEDFDMAEEDIREVEEDMLSYKSFVVTGSES